MSKTTASIRSATSSRRLRQPSRLAACVVGLSLLPLGVGSTAFAATTSGLYHHGARVLLPIGGGYEENALSGFSTVTAQQATGKTVDILVVPSSYGDAPEDRDANLALARERTSQIDAICDATVAASPSLRRSFTGCNATLLVLLNRADAMDPRNSTAFDSALTDGAFILGGDQNLAMTILANSPAEKAMARAYRRGVVISGTSAGAAVQSRSMTAGYSDDGYAENGLEKDSPLIWWGDDSDAERGLSFGSRRTIFDQHFYQRGRFGRLLNLTAQSVPRTPGGLVGVGVDYATGVTDIDDQKLTTIVGDSSVAILDYGTTRVAPTWVGPKQTLTARNVLTHLQAPGTGMTYDLTRRLPIVDGRPVRLPDRAGRATPKITTSARATLLLGGGDNADGSAAVMKRFAQIAGKGSSQRVVIIAAGYADVTAARADAKTYRDALAATGRTDLGQVLIKVHGVDRINAKTVKGAAGVILIGGGQSEIGGAVSDRAFATAVKASARDSAVVMTDGAMTAAMGTRYATDADPDENTLEDEAVRDFRAGNAELQPGFDVVSDATLEPRLTRDYRWGRLFDAARPHPSTLSVGVSELTALELGHGRARVVGDRSVTTLDARYARFLSASNGTFGMINGLISTFGPGQRI
ncbi:MAG: Type 1 glutamine amidotransferase-like domain-containing protein [Humibacillus sp.]|nr:Type 1 glutamine amidotransferase-like domain-containing protein [Humibacillus sp.]MDN5776743.1 Type 1 glutamine amidotransferase-like domain-containing protein [Humibacillus sp.]